MGDMVDNGNALGAKEDLLAIKETIKKQKYLWSLHREIMTAPRKFCWNIFEDYEGVHSIKGYQIINFVDKYNEDESASRCWDKMKNYSAGRLFKTEQSLCYSTIPSTLI